VVSDLSAQEKNNSSGTAEPLFGSPVISQLQSTLEESLTSFSAVGSVKNLAQLGLSIEDDGALSFDSSTLDSLLNTDYSDVQGFLQNTGSFGASLSTTLNNLGTQAPNGAIYLAEQEITSQETTLNTDITNENALIATSKANLTTELNTANQELQAIPEQLNEVNELYSAITGFNTGTSS